MFIGWISDVTILKSISPNFVTMKANTAICFMFIGMSLLLLQTKWQGNKAARIISGFCALVVFMIGFLTLCEYIFGWNLGIDQLLFKESVTAILTSSPGRMSFNTSIIFVLISVTLLLYGFEAVCLLYLAQSLVIMAGTFSFLSFALSVSLILLYRLDLGDYFIIRGLFIGDYML